MSSPRKRGGDPEFSKDDSRKKEATTSRFLNLYYFKNFFHFKSYIIVNSVKFIDYKRLCNY